MATACIALGGNLGDVETAFARARDLLDAHPRIAVHQVSRVYRTSPVGAHAGEEFRNAAAVLETDLSPADLLQVLHEVEDQLGRTRDVRWGPRTLDLDLLLFEARIIDTADLQVPHPACWYRRFVLDPLSEIAPHAVHPQRRATIRELRDRLLQRPLQMALLGGEAAERDALHHQLDAQFSEVVITQPMAGDVAADEDRFTFVVWLGNGNSERDALQSARGFLDVSEIPSPERAAFLADVLRSALD